MHEAVLATILRRYEAEALLIIEPLHGTSRTHYLLLGEVTVGVPVTRTCRPLTITTRIPRARVVTFVTKQTKKMGGHLRGPPDPTILPAQSYCPHLKRFGHVT